jgi:flagellar protein FliO/FliZ
MTGASWTGLLWFVVVLALIPLALWMLKRSGMAGGLRPRAQGGLPRLVGTLAVGAQQRVVTVEVGEGEARRWLVLGVTPQQVNTLHTLEQPPALAVQEPVAAAPAVSFAQALKAQLRKPR